MSPVVSAGVSQPMRASQSRDSLDEAGCDSRDNRHRTVEGCRSGQSLPGIPPPSQEAVRAGCKAGHMANSAVEG